MARGSAPRPTRGEGASPTGPDGRPTTQPRLSSQVLGGWLSGPGTAPDGTVPGAPRLGRPAEGPGSVAGVGRRLGGIVIDLIAAYLIGRVVLLFDRHPGVNVVTGAQTLAFFVQVWLLQATTGQSIGQRFARTRIVSVRGGAAGPAWLALRTVLLVVPPFVLGLIVDADGRGLQDKAAGTVVLTI